MKPEQTRRGQARPAQARLGQARPGQARPDQARPEFNLADLILELAFLLYFTLHAMTRNKIDNLGEKYELYK